MAVARIYHKIITTIDELIDPLASARMQPKVLQPDSIRAEVVHFVRPRDPRRGRRLLPFPSRRRVRRPSDE